MVIYVPWLCRNVILSGYLLYPVPFIDIFTVDWKAPKDLLLLLDYIYIKRLPINFDDGLVPVKPLPFPRWLWPWVQRQISNGMLSQLVVFAAALCSPLYWAVMRLLGIHFTRRAFYCWLLVYTCLLIWWINVPEYRFGIVFISFAITLPLLAAAKRLTKKIALLPALIITLFITEAGWYIYTAPGWKNRRDFSATRFIIYPLRDKLYYENNDTASFNYTPLSNGIKLYHQDSTHDCINAQLPCMIYKYGDIEMRGSTIADGFRNVRDDVGKNYPFVK